MHSLICLVPRTHACMIDWYVGPSYRLYLVGQPLHDAVASEVAWFTAHPGGGAASLVVDELVTMLVLSGEAQAAVAAAETLQVKHCVCGSVCRGGGGGEAMCTCLAYLPLLA